MEVRGLVANAAAAVRILSVGLAWASVAGGTEGLAIAASAAGPPSAADEDLNAKGVALRLAGDNKGALQPFQQAYDLTHSPRATAQLGLVHQALGRWDLAEPLVAKAVLSPSDPWIKKYEAELAKALNVIREHVAHVELVSDPPNTEAFVNGNRVGRLPLADPVPVVVGQVDVELRAPGYHNAIRNLVLEPYQYERLFVRLEKESAGTAVAARDGSRAVTAGGAAMVSEATIPTGGAPARESSAGMNTRRVIKWTTLGLAGAALGTGVVATAVHSSNVDQFRNAHGGGCFDDGGRAVDADGKPVPDCQGPLSTYRTARTWQVAGFVGAGVFAAAWLILQLTEPSEGSPAAGHAAEHALACIPSLPDRGAVCSLRF